MDKFLHILVVDDETLTARSMKGLLEELGHSVSTAEDGESALEHLSQKSFDIVITDLIMPGMDGFALVKRIRRSYKHLLVFILTGHDSFTMARKALRLGADDFLIKPLDKDQLGITLNQAQEKVQLKNKIAQLDKLVAGKFSPSNIIGNSGPMQAVFRLIEKARSTQANVLIQGESGTGKELVARAVYNSHGNPKSNFVSVNCCAISEGLIESELFGHVRGAFSGAISDRQGLFEVANNGTIFLDEIGDLPLNIQTKLLRAIQEKEVRRVGENINRNVNVRIIASTNRNLEEAVKKDQFREDLYYRLNVIPIHLPPLKQRLSDVPVLASHFLKKHQMDGQNISLSPKALQLMQSYHYPGNVRELENIIQRTISFASSDVISGNDISSYIQMEHPIQLKPEIEAIKSLNYGQLRLHLEKLEKEYLTHHLQQCEGNVIRAAQAIQIARTAFHNKIKKLDINLHAIRQSEP